MSNVVYFIDFKVVMVSDCCAALSEEEHRSALETFIQQFGDVMTTAEVLEKLKTGNVEGEVPVPLAV